MNIPLFFPTKRLLLEWNVKCWAFRERTWLSWKTFDTYSLPAHPTQSHIPNPNDNRNVTSVEYWLQFCDYYIWPHLIYYDSVAELAHLLHTMTLTDLKRISDRMKEYNAAERVRVLDTWKRVLRNVALHSPNNPH